ncbi:mechanosensitive ion channel domain-containing protein [Roseibium sp.]|uniref:mechanosensitive ion channel domain-containing protein n=1 Tax=Roseibium sp. TaxID=1936156 RepID=UPI003A96B6AC
MKLPSRLCAVLVVLLLSPFFAGSVSAQVTGLQAVAPSSAEDTVASSEAADEGHGEALSLDAASEALIKVLQDPASRQALIDRLQQLPAATPVSGGSAESTAAPDSQVGEGPEESSDAAFAVRLGQYTRVIVDDARDAVARISHALSGFVLLAKGDVQVRWDKAQQAVLEVAVVLVAAIAVFLLGQRILARLFRSHLLRARRGGAVVRLFLLVLTTGVDLLTVVVGWGAGYAVALAGFAALENGVSLLESLTLNAFLVTGLAKVALRLVFAPGRGELRLLPFKDDTARYWSSRLGFVFSWIGYGLMLGVPVANLTVSFVLGNAVRYVVVILATLFLLALVRRNRHRVANGIKEYAGDMSSELVQKALSRLADFWHVGAYLYVLMVFGVWISRPFDAVAIVMRATGYSVLTIMGGFLLSFMVTRAITGGIRLPEGVKETLPALEGRLNAFVPRILKLIRLLVFIITLLVLLSVWGIIDLDAWVNSPTGLDLMSRYSSAALVLLAAFAIWLAVMSWVDLRLREQAGYVVTARVRTLFQLFRNAFTVVIIVMATLLSLSEIGIDIGPLIAGAGVVGLAISFGAQTLVKDIITGAFIQIENAINEGDVVTVGGITGAVERLTVRSVRLRDVEGTTHIVPFSSVDMVSNFMRDFSYHVAIIGVSYDTDVKKAKAAMEEAFLRLRDSELGSEIIDDLEMHGVVNLGESSVDIRARIKTIPGSQWKVGRAYNEFVKEVFDEQCIEIPFPQVTYHAAAPVAASALIGGLAGEVDEEEADETNDAGSGQSASDGASDD